VNIGVIGWWRHDNQGDLAMLDALRRSLAPHRLVALDTDLEYNPDTLARLNRLDFLLLGGGTLIRGGPLALFNNFRRWGKRLDVPLGVLGLGVTHIEPDSTADIQALIEHSRFFYVRDETSYRLLDNPAVSLAPDLTFAHPLPLTSQPLSGPDLPLAGVNLRKTNDLDPAAWIDPLRRLPCRWRGLPLSSYSSWQEQVGLRTLDPDCSPAFSEALYEGLDLVVGTALHAVIFAVQAGVPVIAIDYASKVGRFMAEIGLADYVLPAGDPAELPNVYGRLITHHQEIREMIGRRRAQLVKESQAMFADVRAAIETAGTKKTCRGEKVSLIVLAGGPPGALEQTLVSCREQTYANIETIVVGDLDPNALQGTERLAKVSPEAGLAERLNAGLAEASGAYLSWLAAGDCFSADAVDVLAGRLEEAMADLVYAGYYTVENEKIETQTPAHPAYKLKRHNVVTPCFLYRRELHNTAGLYDTQSPLPAYDFWLRAAAEHRLCPVQTPLLLAQKRPGSDAAGLERKIRRNYFQTLAPARRLVWKLMDNTLADRLLRTARSILRHGGAAAGSPT
jgi:hypothetical protein